MRALLLAPIRFYQRFVSPALPRRRSVATGSPQT